MKFLKLTKKINTKIVDFQKTEDGKFKTDEKGNRVAARERTLAISDVEVPQFESLQEAVQTAGGEDKLLESINKWTKDEAVAPVRIVGGKYNYDDPDDKIIAEGRAIAKTINPFEDRRGGGNAQNKILADQYKELQALKESGASDADLLAAFKKQMGL